MFGGIEAGAGEQRPPHVPGQPARQPGDLDPGRLPRRAPDRAAGRRPPLHRAAAARPRPHRRAQPSLAAHRSLTARRGSTRIVSRHEGRADRQRLPPSGRAGLPRPRGDRRRARPAGRVVGLDHLPRDGRAGTGDGRRARRARHRRRRAGGDGQPQLGPAADRAVRRVRLRSGPRADQLPPRRRGGQVHRRPLRRPRPAGRPRAGRRPGRRRVRAQVRSSAPRPTPC